MKRQSLEAILGEKFYSSYQEQYEYIKSLLDSGKLKPVKSSGKNGKKPALFLEYWLQDEEQDYSELKRELIYDTDTRISYDYYLRNLAVYEKERVAVRQLNAFLRQHSELLRVAVSFNESSLQIWGYEKFLSLGNGKTILKHCGLSLDFLNCYSTTEPFAYFSLTRNTPQNILIIENKDTFFSMRKHFLSGKHRILGTEFGTLIYGGGKRVVSSFQQFDLSAEPYMLDCSNEFFYLGDLDYEGIGIYENLYCCFKGQAAIQPFLSAYEMMLTKAKGLESLPVTKEGQNRQLQGFFFYYFSTDIQQKMRNVLEKDLYIPHEILTVLDY